MSKERKIKPEIKKELEKNLLDLKLIRKYVNEFPDKLEIIDLEEKTELLLSGYDDLKIKDIYLLSTMEQETKDLSKHILHKYKKIISKDRVAIVAQNTGLKETDVKALVNKGIDINDIEKISEEINIDNIDAKMIVEKAEELGIVKNESEILNLDEIGFIIDETDKGDWVVADIEEVVNINDLGLIEFEQKWEDNFELMNVTLPDDMNVIELDANMLEITPVEEVENSLDSEEAEKNDISKSINEDPYNIVSILRINDLDAGSKLFDTYISSSAESLLVVRLRNNKFILLEEDSKGQRKEIKGLEVTPVANEVAANLENKVGNLSTDVKPGNIIPAKTTDRRKYDLFIIGDKDKIDNDENHLLYIKTSSNETQMDVITNHNGGYDLELANTDNVYPKTIIVNGKEKYINGQDPIKEESMNLKIPNDLRNQIDERIDKLEELLETEKKIDEIEESEDKEKLDEEYSKRDQLLDELGYSQDEAVEAEQEAELELGERRIGPNYY